jgi:L-fuculose-phosphate aldolase
VDDGLVVGSAGNVSMRLDARRAVVSAGGRLYHQLTPADHPVVDLTDGTWIGPCKPTSEMALHRTLLGRLAEVDAVVHTHSRYSAAFAVARLGLPFICNESMVTRAEQALATFQRQPGSRAVLLANHGVVAVGPSLDDAYVVAQAVEWTAEICHHARTLLGAPAGEFVLDSAVQDLIGRSYGVTIAREQA